MQIPSRNLEDLRATAQICGINLQQASFEMTADRDAVFTAGQSDGSPVRRVAMTQTALGWTVQIGTSSDAPSLVDSAVYSYDPTSRRCTLRTVVCGGNDEPRQDILTFARDDSRQTTVRWSKISSELEPDPKDPKTEVSVRRPRPQGTVALGDLSNPASFDKGCPLQGRVMPALEFTPGSAQGSPVETAGRFGAPVMPTPSAEPVRASGVLESAAAVVTAGPPPDWPLRQPAGEAGHPCAAG